MLNVQFVKDSLIFTALIAITSGYVLTIGNSIKQNAESTISKANNIKKGQYLFLEVYQ